MKLKNIFISGLALTIALQPLAAVAQSSQFTYSTAGKLAQVVKPQGQTYQYAYDQSGQISTYSLPNPSGTGAGGSIGYAWDGMGSLASVSDARGLTTSYAVSGFAEVTSVTSPDTGQSSFQRNQVGAVTSRSDGRGTASFTYDALNRMVGANYGDASTTFTYDTALNGKGRLAGMQDASGHTGWDYDIHGNASFTQVTTGPTGGSGAALALRATYSQGNLTSLTYPSGRVVTYSYDGARVTGISVNGTAIISNVQYQTFGPVTGWQMGTIGTYSRTFDTAGRITAYTYDNGQRTLGWDASNRITAINNPDGSQWLYAYDNLDQLVSATEGIQGLRTFSLDTSGNRLSTTINGTSYTYGVDANSNRLTTSTAPATAASYSYDNVGQMLSDGSRSYTWTKAGYLASATTSQGTTNYSYNGMGQRVKKVKGSGSTASARHYLYAEDGTSLIGEYFQTNASAPVGALYELIYLEGIPVAVMRGGAIYYIQPDHLNTPRAIKDATGGLVWQWASDAYGNGAANQNPGGVFFFEFNPRLPGQQFDSETGLYYNNARYYDPMTGRYISSDPIGLAGGLNTYGYVESNPLSNTDPTGNAIFLLAAPFIPEISAGAVYAATAAIGVIAAITSYHVSPTVQTVTKAIASQIPIGDKVYVTYERYNSTTKEYYCGRASGYRNPIDAVNLTLMSLRHVVLSNEGFGPMQFDKSTDKYSAIRGREQQLIDFRGGAKSVGGTARNKINGVSDFNGNRPEYMAQAVALFGTLPDNSPSRPRLTH